MKIALLAAASSIHAIRWANGLSLAGHEVHLISQHKMTGKLSDAVIVHQLPFSGMAGYYLNAIHVRSLIKKIHPDILNAHYASGYGTSARWTGFHPYVLSVWGSDVYDFPYKSGFHKKLIQKNLKAADSIASTSKCMAEQTREVMQENAEIAITPFGVEMDKFSTKRESRRDCITIGTVKTLAPKYGIDTLIRAFALAKQKLIKTDPEINLELMIVGDGPQRSELEGLATNLNLLDSVHFIGFVPHHDVPGYLTQFDIFVALSRFESFGVAVVEAGAASLPVVVSDVGGLPEVTDEGVTGFIVKKDDPQDAAQRLVYLCQDRKLREQMGEAGFQHVLQRYNWPVCIQKMLDVYKNAIEKAHI